MSFYGWSITPTPMVQKSDKYGTIVIRLWISWVSRDKTEAKWRSDRNLMFIWRLWTSLEKAVSVGGDISSFLFGDVKSSTGTNPSIMRFQAFLVPKLPPIHGQQAPWNFATCVGGPRLEGLVECLWGQPSLKAWHRGKIPTACTLQDSILCGAVETGCLPLVQTLLKGPNLVPPRRNGPLQTAVLAALLDFGADPNLVNGNGDSPLHLAVMHAEGVFCWWVQEIMTAFFYFWKLLWVKAPVCTIDCIKDSVHKALCVYKLLCETASPRKSFSVKRILREMTWATN